MTLFIGNLSYDVRQREIEDIFSRYGRVSRVDLKRGYCFVEYEDKRDAEDALRTEHGSSLAGSKMSVEWAKSDRKSSNSNDCFKCGKPGHWARDCPDNGGGGGRRGRSRSRSRDRDRYSRGKDRSRSRDRDRDRDRRRSPAGRSRSPPPRRDRSRSRSPRRD